jgi:hypothetical protein
MEMREFCSSSGKLAFVGMTVWADAIIASPSDPKRQDMVLATVDVVMLRLLAGRRRR